MPDEEIKVEGSQEEVLDNLDKKPRVKRNKKGHLLPGQPSLNPVGRPRGLTIKEKVRNWLIDHPDDEKAFVEHFVKKNKELAWQMLEGRPQQDVTSGGETIQPILVKFLDGKPEDNRDTQ